MTKKNCLLPRLTIHLFILFLKLGFHFFLCLLSVSSVSLSRWIPAKNYHPLILVLAPKLDGIPVKGWSHVKVGFLRHWGKGWMVTSWRVTGKGWRWYCTLDNRRVEEKVGGVGLTGQREGRGCVVLLEAG